MTTPTHPTLGQRLTGLAASVAVLGILVGLPALFLAIGASPIPDQAPTLESIKNALLAPDDGTLVLGLFKVIGWAAWAFMALSVLAQAGPWPTAALESMSTFMTEMRSSLIEQLH